MKESTNKRPKAKSLAKLVYIAAVSAAADTMVKISKIVKGRKRSLPGFGKKYAGDTKRFLRIEKGATNRPGRRGAACCRCGQYQGTNCFFFDRPVRRKKSARNCKGFAWKKAAWEGQMPYQEPCSGGSFLSRLDNNPPQKSYALIAMDMKTIERLKAEYGGQATMDEVYRDMVKRWPVTAMALAAK